MLGRVAQGLQFGLSCLAQVAQSTGGSAKTPERIKYPPLDVDVLKKIDTFPIVVIRLLVCFQPVGRLAQVQPGLGDAIQTIELLEDREAFLFVAHRLAQ